MSYNIVIVRGICLESIYIYIKHMNTSRYKTLKQCVTDKQFAFRRVPRYELIEKRLARHYFNNSLPEAQKEQTYYIHELRYILNKITIRVSIKPRHLNSKTLMLFCIYPPIQENAYQQPLQFFKKCNLQIQTH